MSEFHHLVKPFGVGVMKIQFVSGWSLCQSLCKLLDLFKKINPKAFKVTRVDKITVTLPTVVI